MRQESAGEGSPPRCQPASLGEAALLSGHPFGELDLEGLLITGSAIPGKVLDSPSPSPSFLVCNLTPTESLYPGPAGRQVSREAGPPWHMPLLTPSDPPRSGPWNHVPSEPCPQPWLPGHSPTLGPSAHLQTGPGSPGVSPGTLTEEGLRG